MYTYNTIFEIIHLLYEHGIHAFVELQKQSHDLLSNGLSKNNM